jgi:glucose-1-phosphate thymidylyltransferase
MHGILLAGGTGSRLFPITAGTNKHLLPVYNKPMIYYSLSTLMLAGIRDIVLITSPGDVDRFTALLGDGSHLGLRITYRTQTQARGIAEAFLIAEDIIQGYPVALALGDNLLYGSGFTGLLQSAVLRLTLSGGAVIFGAKVENPRDYGVAEVDAQGTVIGLEEKPREPRSPWAVPGLYFYDARVTEFARALAPSARGELEITDLNRVYQQSGGLHLVRFPRGMTWLDTGSPDNLADAGDFVRTIEKRQGIMIGCVEEIAWRQHFISDKELLAVAERWKATPYGQYLAALPADAPH